MRIIVAISGGKASAWCIKWALEHFKKEDILLYFNDTKWEHPDLYRFLKDLEAYFNHRIFFDSDGRSPEDLFFQNRALANNRWPFCSRILKAERLQRFFKNGDVLVFGISSDEKHRARRLVDVYQNVSLAKKKNCQLKFPLISSRINKEDLDLWIKSTGIAAPVLYQLGFNHNNCSGGCVRAGKKQWLMLLDKLPEVYRERERVEEAVRDYLKKDVHFLKDETLKSLRMRNRPGTDFSDEEEQGECFGICSSIS